MLAFTEQDEVGKQKSTSDHGILKIFSKQFPSTLSKSECNQSLSTRCTNIRLSIHFYEKIMLESCTLIFSSFCQLKHI